MILLANKCDHPNRTVTAEEGRALAQGYKIPFYETSAANATNVQAAYTDIATTVARRVLPDEPGVQRTSLTRLRRGGSGTGGKMASCC